MRFVSWNVNGLRACLGKGFRDSIMSLEPDFLCLQETKMERGQAEHGLEGYVEFWNSAVKKGYSGTAIFAKEPPISHFLGMGKDEHDQEGRIIALEYAGFYLVCVYTPNSQRELARLSYRMRWEDDFREYLTKLDKKRPVIICGDLNVAHNEIDIKNPKTNRRNAGFTDEERQKMSTLLENGFYDTFRQLHPDTKDAYTWWSYMSKSRERNIGWRIDYFLVSQRFMPHVTAASIFPDIHGSDHCPVALDIKI